MSEPDEADECEMKIECPYCDGDGMTIVDGMHDTEGEYVGECPYCNGTGWY